MDQRTELRTSSRGLTYRMPVVSKPAGFGTPLQRSFEQLNQAAQVTLAHAREVMRPIMERYLETLKKEAERSRRRAMMKYLETEQSRRPVEFLSNEDVSPDGVARDARVVERSTSEPVSAWRTVEQNDEVVPWERG